MAVNEIFQYSIISALMDGVASKGLPISSLVSQGDHGLGTFERMRGEMILVDGKVFQMRSDGTVVPYDSAEDLAKISPFATVTRFQATSTIKTLIPSKEGLSDLVTRLLPENKNRFTAIRIDGLFKEVRVRTAAGQTFPHEGLIDVGKNQAENVFQMVRGTVIGFRGPSYVMGLNVVGDHLHFITDDRKHGGHILGIESEGEAELAVAPISKVHLELPVGDEEFDTAPLVGDAQGIAAVEG